MGEASNLLMQMNLMRDESLNLTVAYSAHEVCMRCIRVTSLIGKFFRVETDFVQLSQFRFGEYFLKMGWLPIMIVKEPIYPKLIRAFYIKNVVVHVGGPITISCSLRGVNRMLNEEKICEILRVQSDGDKVYESNSLPNIDNFVVREVIQLLCGGLVPYDHGKSNVHSLTPPSHVLHHIVTYSLVPRGGHRNEVLYLEAFLVYSIIVGRHLNIGYIIMNHMVVSCENKTRILPYGRNMTKVFKEFGIEFTLDDEVDEPSPYDTYNDMAMGRMKFEKAFDGSWVHSIDDVVDDEEDIERDMADVRLNTPPLHTYNEETYALTSGDETCLASQFEQLHLRIDRFENRVSSNIAQLSNQMNRLSAQHLKLITLVHSNCPPPPPLA